MTADQMAAADNGINRRNVLTDFRAIGAAGMKFAPVRQVGRIGHNAFDGGQTVGCGVQIGDRRKKPGSAQDRTGLLSGMHFLARTGPIAPRAA